MQNLYMPNPCLIAMQNAKKYAESMRNICLIYAESMYA